MKKIQSEKQVKGSAASKVFNKAGMVITKAAGSLTASVIAFAIILGWALTGPLFNWSDTWQLVINTSTTIVTFLMVFIIQQSQNRETTAIQLKLNELIASNEKASNRLVDIEDLTEEELNIIKKFYIKLSDLAEREGDLHSSHSLDEASENMQTKLKGRKKTPARHE